MSFGSEIAPIGDRVLMKSFGVFLWSGVSTTPGATGLKRMLSFGYSFARLRVIASSPPLVIIATDAGRPAMGFSSNDAVMVVTLPPVPCDRICLTASWVMKINPSRLVEARPRKIVGSVVRERLGYEDARVVDNMVDRAELGN